MRIVQITTDNRNQYGQHTLAEPYFGTAPAGLLEGFVGMPGVEVHVVSCASARMAAPAKLADNIWFHQPYIPKLGWGRTLFLGCVHAVRGLMKEIQPDIVHGQGTERNCAMCAVLSGYPNVLTIHGNMRVHSARPENRKNSYYKLAALLESFALRRSNGVVAISRYTEELVQGLVPRTWLLPNAAHLHYFDIDPAPPMVPRILFVGSIDERKNPLGLLQACEPMLRAGECTLAIAGQGNDELPYVQDVFRLAAALPGVDILGFIGRDELGEQFRRSSLLVLPTFEDNCPMVVLEAMAAGVPVVASRVGGVPDLITHEKDGLMFDPKDPANVRESLERLIREPVTRARLGTAGRITARERFHPQVIAAAHLEIYREVLGR